ncbi:MAG TPA: GNAT family N-acetyltransferase [Ohtaekwangia sp.]|uniref:GNAT family N-acetyltransferase n=1 Tax=Ohtaekwangia sp. TaxID=2066019 RepID=UPI002F945EAA
MEIRKATVADLPAIVALLKASLGEGLMPKSEGYWLWKHQQNPFGESPVLVASEGDTIIGIRAFMRWRWLRGEQSFEAIRAVDTATHPDYQGKGIFSKLTYSLLDECKANGWHFVFNTPNEKSKPGYLKMGWKEAGKLPVSLCIAKPFNTIRNILTSNVKPFENHNDESVSYFFGHKGLPQLITDNRKHYSNCLVTDHSVNSLRWRYEHVPVAQYFAAGIEEQERLPYLFFYRIKPTRMGRELRITDFYFTATEDFNSIRNLVNKKIKEHNADYATLGGFSAMNILRKGLSLRNMNIGPIVTVRNVNLQDMHSLVGFSNWSPTLGDLELF